MATFVDEQRARWGVEPICRTLAIAPSSYYAAKIRPPSARAVRDAALTDSLVRIHRANFGVYGVRKAWRTLQRLGIDAGRDQVARLMRTVGLAGVTRNQTDPDDEARTAEPAPGRSRRADLRGRCPEPPVGRRPDLRLDEDRVRVHRFVVDVFSRAIVGWRVAASLHAELALDALEMAIWARGPDLPDLVHHSDRGVQYLAIKYTERLAEAEAVSSVGSRGDSYDNALAETVNGLYKAELINRQGPWRSVEQVELATA